MDLGFGAAHHAGDGERPGSIADQHGEVVQRAVHVIQRFQALAGLGGAGNDGGGLAAGALQQHIVVEGVQRLTHLQHHIVGDVYHVVDRAHAGQLEAALHPVGAGADLQTLDQAEDEARVQLGVGNFNPRFALNGGAFSDKVEEIWRQAQRLAGESGHFAGHAQDAGGAGGVGQDGDAQHGIAHVIHQRHAHRGVVIQDDDALVVFRNAQLFF